MAVHIVQAGRYFRPSTRDHSGYANFKPTRGNMLMVFARMDDDQNGIITEAEFLAVMVDLGITVEEAQSLFCRHDISSLRKLHGCVRE